MVEVGVDWVAAVGLILAAPAMVLVHELGHPLPAVVAALLEWVPLYLLVQLAVTLVPVEYPSWLGRYGGQPSDGRRFLSVLQDALE